MPFPEQFQVRKGEGSSWLEFCHGFRLRESKFVTESSNVCQRAVIGSYISGIGIGR